MRKNLTKKYGSWIVRLNKDNFGNICVFNNGVQFLHTFFLVYDCLLITIIYGCLDCHNHVFAKDLMTETQSRY